MPRVKRYCPAGEVFHVLNRAAARRTLFKKPNDYEAFLHAVDDTWEIVPLPIFAMTIMPNHWHFVVRPDDDSQVSEFFRRLSGTHSRRWHAHYETTGSGHLYQGRFKSFPVSTDEYFLTVIRYVERNPLRAGLVQSSLDWRWSSAWLRQQPPNQRPCWLIDPIDPPLPRERRSWLDQPQTEAEVAAIVDCIRNSAPYGNDDWKTENAARLGLTAMKRPRGRPKKANQERLDY